MNTDPPKPASGIVTARSSIWSTGSNLLGRIIAFVATVVLARLLDPEDFGIVAIGMISIGLLDAFRNLGVGDALIYRQRNDDVDSDTGFWIALATGAALTVLTWVMAPFVGGFFNNAAATPVILALSVVFFIESTAVIHAARAQRDFQFHKRASAELTKAVVKGLTSIAFAMAGFGYWSLVIGQLVGTVFGSTMYWWLVEWRPRLRFSISASRGLITYGGILILINFLGFAITRLDQIVIGRQLTELHLGYYAVGFTLADLLVANLARTVGLATYPAFARLKNDKDKLALAYLDVQYFIGLLSMSLGVGLFVVADNLIYVLYSEKWLEAVPVVKAIAIFSILHAISYTFGDVLKATGAPRYITYAQVTWLLVGTPIYIYFSKYGISAVAWCVVAMQALSGIIMVILFSRNTAVTTKQIGTTLWPALVAALVMYVVLTMVNQWIANPIYGLLIDVIVGAAVFACVIEMLRPGTIARIKSVFRPPESLASSERN